jgi:hypothetical protein
LIQSLSDIAISLLKMGCRDRSRTIEAFSTGIGRLTVLVGGETINATDADVSKYESAISTLVLEELIHRSSPESTSSIRVNSLGSFLISVQSYQVTGKGLRFS